MINLPSLRGPPCHSGLDYITSPTNSQQPLIFIAQPRKVAREGGLFGVGVAPVPLPSAERPHDVSGRRNRSTSCSDERYATPRVAANYADCFGAAFDIVAIGYYTTCRPPPVPSLCSNSEWNFRYSCSMLAVVGIFKHPGWLPLWLPFPFRAGNSSPHHTLHANRNDAKHGQKPYGAQRSLSHWITCGHPTKL